MAFTVYSHMFCMHHAQAVFNIVHLFLIYIYIYIYIFILFWYRSISQFLKWNKESWRRINAKKWAPHGSYHSRVWGVIQLWYGIIFFCKLFKAGLIPKQGIDALRCMRIHCECDFHTIYHITYSIYYVPKWSHWPKHHEYFFRKTYKLTQHSL